MLDKIIDKIIDKILNIFLDNEIIDSLEKNPACSGFIKKIKDRKFMIHIIKYLFFGVLTTIISLGSFWLLIETTELNENICNFLSIVIGILAAYALNREYVFESKERDIIKEFSKFVMARVASFLFDMISFFIFATLLSLNEMAVKVIISVVVVILNYFLSKILVFNKKEKF